MISTFPYMNVMYITTVFSEGFRVVAESMLCRLWWRVVLRRAQCCGHPQQLCRPVLQISINDDRQMMGEDVRLMAVNRIVVVGCWPAQSRGEDNFL
jgi:hypothetical protein